MKFRWLLPFAAFALVVACTPEPPPPPPPPPVAPTITTTSLPYALVGVAYSQTLTATGDAPITWSIDSGTLPAGLSLSPAGVISGTPTDPALFSNFLPVVFKATNGGGSDTESLVIEVYKEAAPGTYEDPDGTGVPLPEGAAIAFTHGASVMSAIQPLFQYLADGTIHQAASPNGLFNLTGPIRPNPTLLTALSGNVTGGFARDLSLQTRLAASLDQIELWGGSQLFTHSLLHTYPADAGILSPRAAISPDGTKVAIYGDDTVSAKVKIYETTSPYSELRSVSFTKPVSSFVNWASWDRDSSRLALNVGSVFSATGEVKVIGATTPALDEAPSGYDGCLVTAIGAGHRLLMTCLEPGFVFSIRTGAPDGSGSHTVYVSGTPLSFVLPSTASPSGTYVVINEDNGMAYLEDIPLNPMSPQTPVVLTTKIPGMGMPPASQDIGVEWSNTEWPRS